MIQTIIKTNKYDGKYIALKDFKDHTVISEGQTPQEAYKNAQDKGCKDPVITFVPIKDMVQIY